MTTYTESTSGLVYPQNGNGHALAESLHELRTTVMLQEATIADLRTQIQEQGWMRLDGSGAQEFSRADLGTLVAQCRAAYLKNPLVNRAVEIAALYVWGQDLSVTAEDENVQAVVDRFWRDNQATLTGQQASRLLEVELEVTGNVFLALFPDRVTGTVKVRGVPMEEIVEIVTNPEDRAEVWYYRRRWTERAIDGKTTDREALYPDWRYAPADQPTSVAGTDGTAIDIRWESPLVHVKAGAFPHWRWGVPEVYAALDWARAYKEQLEDDATRSRALARFAWNLTTKGGRTAVAAAKTKLGTTLASTSGETNPPPAAGSTFIGGDGVDLNPIRVAGATLDPDHSRPARLMASAALGIPDHFFDANQSNLATSKTLDRPTELRFTERREVWIDVFSGLVDFAIDADLAATRGILPKTITDEQRAVDLSFPSLLERETREVVNAIVDAATLLGRDLKGTIPRETVARELMAALDIEDINGEIEKLEAEWDEQDARRDEMAQRFAQTPPPNQPPAQQDEERESFVAALRELREAIRAGTP